MDSAEERERKSKRRGNLAEFLAASPLRGSGLVLKRQRGQIAKHRVVNFLLDTDVVPEPVKPQKK